MSTPSTWPLSEDSIRFVAPAFLVSMMANNCLTNGCYPTAMGYYPCAYDHQMKRAAPDDNLLLYCVAGAGSVRSFGSSFQVQAGDIVLLRHGVAHEYAADRKSPWSIYWLHFLGSNAVDFCRHAGADEQQVVVHVGVLPGLIALFNTLLMARHTGYSSLAFIHAASQLRQVFTQIALEAQAPPARKSTLDLAIVQTFMQEHLHSALDLDTVAKVAGLSKFHFSHCYRLATGYSPMRHFTHMKMEAACRLLDTTDHTIQYIAASLSFDDPLYFSRVFRNIIGCSPRQYRGSNHG